MAVLVVAAGYLYFTGAHASIVIQPPRPPIEAIAVHYVTTAKNSDGSTSNQMFCFNNLVASAYGPYTYCYAGRKNGTSYQARFGNWNAIANSFFPATAWMNQLSPFYGIDATVGKYVPIHFVGNCKNIPRPFYGFGPVATAFGPLYYGEIFRPTTSNRFGWQIQQAIYSPITKQCSASQGWQNITGYSEPPGQLM